MRTIPKDTVCHLAHYATDDGRNIFVLSDVAKVISTTIIATAANLDNVKATWFKTAGNASTIFNLIQCADPSPVNIVIILCSIMEEKNVIIRLAANMSLHLAFKDLKRKLDLLSAVIQTTLSSDVDTDIVANSFNVTPDVSEIYQSTIENSITMNAMSNAMSRLATTTKAIGDKILDTTGDLENARQSLESLKEEFRA